MVTRTEHPHPPKGVFHTSDSSDLQTKVQEREDTDTEMRNIGEIEPTREIAIISVIIIVHLIFKKII